MSLNLPPDLLHAIAQEGSSKVALIIGAGCSVEPPTNLPLSLKLSEEAHRQLLNDGILIEGECINPSDLSCLADTVIKKYNNQNELVNRLPKSKFKNAKPNEGHLVAAAMLREKILCCVLTINLDLAMTHALAFVGGDNVSIIAKPQEYHDMGAVNLIYLHGNADLDASEWILSTAALEKGYKDGWKEVIAQKFVTSPVTIFAGLGTPAAVLIDSTKRIRHLLNNKALIFQVDPSEAEKSVFYNELNLEPSNYIKTTWNLFMKALSERVTKEQTEKLKNACIELSTSEGIEISKEKLVRLCECIDILGLLGFGKLRAKCLLSEERYLPNVEFRVELMADLLVGTAFIENEINCNAKIYDDGVVEFWLGDRLVGTIAIASGRGYRRWLTLDAELSRFAHNWIGHSRRPHCILISGITDSKPVNISSPKSIVRGEDEDSLFRDDYQMYKVDDIIKDKNLIRGLLS
jgi:hypothetical protein